MNLNWKKVREITINISITDCAADPPKSKPINPSLYTNNAEDYMLDIPVDIRVVDQQRISEFYIKSYNNIFDKFINKDKNL